jgi:hypothetical protein
MPVMLSDITGRQVAALALDPDRSLVICDVDEVVVHFTRAFEVYIAKQDLWLDPRSFSLGGNIRRRRTGDEVLPAEVGQLIGLFFSERTRHLEPIEGAVEWLLQIGKRTEIVLLSNLPHEAADARRQNLRDHGLNYPLISNSGPKGPVVKAIAGETSQTVVFIDDSPQFIASVHEHVPGAHLIHFLHDQRFARHLTPLPFVSLTTGSWMEAGPHILMLVGEGQ